MRVCRITQNNFMTFSLCLFIWTNQSASEPQAIHLCKEESSQVQQNHQCRISQRAGWAPNPHRRAAERSPWTATCCWCRPVAGTHLGHNPGRSCSHASCRCHGDLDKSGSDIQTQWGGGTKDRKLMTSQWIQMSNYFNFLKLLWPFTDTLFNAKLL